MTAQVTFKLESLHADGSYSALCAVYGQEFAVHLVNEEIRVYGTGGQAKRSSWQVKGAAKLVKQAVAAHIANAGEAFLSAHRSLYAQA